MSQPVNCGRRWMLKRRLVESAPTENIGLKGLAVEVLTALGERDAMIAATEQRAARDDQRRCSAGTERADKINGYHHSDGRGRQINIAAEQPKIVPTQAVEASDIVITMGCGGAWSLLPGKLNETGSSTTPQAMTSTMHRPIRDEIRCRVEH
jgi:arsenate reductase (thioredoxin)